jgi:parallel beta-helix repeat protein
MESMRKRRNMKGAGRVFRAIAMSVFLLSAYAALIEIPRSEAAYEMHSPILINGDMAIGDSGITGGTGTELDPYIIEGWQIDHFDENCIDIQNSNSHYLIRNVYLRPSPEYQYHAQYGVHIDESSNVSVENCLIENNEGTGIMVYDSRNIRISNNHLSNNPLYLGACRDVSVDANQFNSSSIRLLGSNSINLSNNIIDTGGIFIDGSRVEDFSTHTIASTNTIGGKPVLYFKNQSPVVIDENIVGGEVIIANCSGVRIADLNMTNTSGLFVNYCDDIVVSHVEAFKNHPALVFLQASNVTITNCSFRQTSWDKDLLLYNAASVFMRGATDAIIGSCSVSGNYDGIDLVGAASVTVVSCNLSGYRGISCYWSTNTTIRGNDFGRSSERAVNLQDCVGFEVYQNNIGFNSIDDSSGGANNSWDDGYPAGGNYWGYFKGHDNCSGPDQDTPGSDGISDTMYWFDHYPLMEPYTYPHPRAAFTVASVANSTNTYAVDATRCWDPNDPLALLEVRWDWNGDGKWDTPWSTNKTAEHHYSEPGNYTVSLEVRDSQGLSSVTLKNVIVEGVLWTTYLLYALAIVTILAAILLLLHRGRKRRLNITEAFEPKEPAE